MALMILSEICTGTTAEGGYPLKTVVGGLGGLPGVSAKRERHRRQLGGDTLPEPPHETTDNWGGLPRVSDGAATDDDRRLQSCLKTMTDED